MIGHADASRPAVAVPLRSHSPRLLRPAAALIVSREASRKNVLPLSLTPVTIASFYNPIQERLIVFAKTFHATHPDMMDSVSNDDLRDRYLVTGMFRDGE